MPELLCIGHAAWDLALKVATIPGPDEKARATARAAGGGGPAATAACTAARLGAKVAFAGRIGQDWAGDCLLDEFSAFGVDARFVRRTDAPTPISAILVRERDGARTIANHNPGGWLERLDWGGIRPQWVLADGHEPLLAEHWLGKAPMILDAGSLHPGTERLMRRVEVLAASERFAREATQHRDPKAMLAALAGWVPYVVITLGERGLVWAAEGERGAMPAFAIEAVDTTGAGDVFHGALAWALLRGKPWPEALRWAQGAAAIACTGFGARTWLPTADEVRHFLAAASLRDDCVEV
ncbi:MAG: carbohydrate kinase [Zetaproteobacteria bacterium]|nr:MAG: carbohydrate kinase [Zetaproteobacteria bacterium]